MPTTTSEHRPVPLSSRCPECGHDHSRPIIPRFPRWPAVVFAALLAISIAFLVRTPFYGSSGPSPEGFDAGDLTPCLTLTGRYLRECREGAADPQIMREALAHITQHTWDDCPPPPTDNLILSAGPPTAEVVTEHRIGWPFAWFNSEERTGYTDATTLSGPFLDPVLVNRPDYFDDHWTWSWRWFYARFFSLYDGVTELHMWGTGTSLVMYIALLLVLRRMLHGARQDGARWRAVATGSAIAVIIVGMLLPTRTTHTYTDWKSGLIPVAVPTLPRAQVDELLRTDAGVRELADRIYHGVTGYIGDDASVRAGFCATAALTRDWREWTTVGGSVLEVHTFDARDDTTTARWKPGVRLRLCRYCSVRLTIERAGLRKAYRVYAEPFVFMLVTTVGIGMVLNALLRISFARRLQHRASRGLCQSCAYPIPGLNPRLAQAA